MGLPLPPNRVTVPAFTSVLSRRRGTILLLVVLLGAAGCGSYGDEGAGTTTAASTATVSASEAETALKAELSQGGSGIVQLETDTPKQVTCKKDAGTKSGWRCTVTPSKGSESYLCMVEVDPQTNRTTKTTCARIDN